MRGRVILSALMAGALLSGCSVARGFGVGSSEVDPSALCPGKPRARHLTVVDWWEVWPQANMMKSAQQFNCAHPSIAVNISVAPQVGDDTDGKLLAAVAAKKPPDLVLSWDDGLASWANRHEIQPLDDLAARYGFDKKDYFDAPWKSTMWKGRQYGIPVNWDPDTLLWYNKKVFADAGLDPEKPPATWAQLQSYSDRIDRIENGRIKRIGFAPWVGWQFNYIQLGHMMGADMQDGDRPSVRVDSPGMRRVFGYFHGKAKKYGGAAKVNAFTNTAKAGGTGADALLSGRVGMEIVGDWENSQAQNVGARTFRETVGVTKVPTPPGGAPYLSHSGWSFMIPAGSGHQRETMEFVRWILQDRNFATYFGKNVGWLSAKKSTRNQPYVTQNPILRKIAAIEKAEGLQWWLPPSPILEQYYRALDESVASLTALQKSPAEAADDAQHNVQNALDNATALGVYR